MLFSEKWLREWVNPPVSSDELMAQLSMAGLEVDGSELAARPFTGVVVGEVLEVQPHPDADKLRVCRVSDGRETHQVVCGAANVRAGLKVPFATLGAQLAPDFKIKKAKLRGVESHGMLCSADELSIAENSEGLLELDAGATPGQDIREHLALDDCLIEVDLTPNRGDCLSIAGLAREVGVLYRLPVIEPGIEAVPHTREDRLPVELLSPADCPRYLGRVIRNVDTSAGSPFWLQERLRRAGIRSIDPVVDVTNYVLMELGQPMHAFDLERLEGGIRVRRANAGEKLTLLDGRELELRDDTLVIADHAKALAMAGVMGGLHSAVGEGTRHIFLESAFFSPLAIAGKARSYGLQTDAAHRYERGVDFELPRRAMERATALLLDIVGGEPGPVEEAVAELPRVAPITLRAARIRTLLGMELQASEVEDILRRLGMKPSLSAAGEWRVEVPSWRFDIAIEVDLIEELARVYGYDNLPVSSPQRRISLRPVPEGRVTLPDLRRRLCALGYQEVITYSFVEPRLEAALSGEGSAPIVLANPISQDMSVMRSGLWAGLLKTLKHNQNRQQTRVRLFESGLRFRRSRHGSVEQTPALAGLAWGGQLPEQWGAADRQVDFYDLKGDVENLLALCLEPQAFRFRAGSHPALQAGQSAEILRGDASLGWLGALAPGLQRQLDIPHKVYLFELDLGLLSGARLPVARELSRYPQVRRDIALLVDATLEMGEILDTIKRCAGELLVDCHAFDLYQGGNLAKDKKSLALGLTFQHPSRTLNDDEITSTINKCIKVLESEFKAELRQ